MGAGIMGAVVCAQLPEFSQQYQQRLGGAIAEMRVVVARFDESLAGVGLSRESAEAAALDESGIGQRLITDGLRHAERLAHLERAEARLAEAGPLREVITLPFALDRDLARATYAAFAPAVPATLAGLAYGGAGFLAGWLLFALGLGGGRALLRRLFGWGAIRA